MVFVSAEVAVVAALAGCPFTYNGGDWRRLIGARRCPAGNTALSRCIDSYFHCIASVSLEDFPELESSYLGRTERWHPWYKIIMDAEDARTSGTLIQYTWPSCIASCHPSRWCRGNSPGTDGERHQEHIRVGKHLVYALLSI
ncbi:hypothetical protein OE88DRAFT_1032818 [Heliocybe sulcata]|uniref:Uncharacterized protein n=1 Tax=Heliocybe sulcata TaxID=5364 RepID=A0A5C3NCA5_9AGAM|nr:hypothetical protein OE88DRAFT_1032818 [Heliocybe sulcata]